MLGDDGWCVRLFESFSCFVGVKEGVKFQNW